MKRRTFLGGALAGVSVAGAFPASQRVKAGDVPTTTFGKTGVTVSVIAQGGARMDLHPDVQSAAAHVRKVYDLGVTYFEDNVRTVQNLRKMTPEEIADVRKRAVVGAGVYTGPAMEYWKKRA